MLQLAGFEAPWQVKEENACLGQPIVFLSSPSYLA